MIEAIALSRVAPPSVILHGRPVVLIHVPRPRGMRAAELDSLISVTGIEAFAPREIVFLL